MQLGFETMSWNSRADIYQLSGWKKGLLKGSEKVCQVYFSYYYHMKIKLFISFCIKSSIIDVKENSSGLLNRLSSF